MDFNCEDVLYFESFGHYIEVNMNDGSSFRKRGVMRELVNKLNKRSFVRVHRGYVVNLKYVKFIKNNHVVMLNNKEIPVGGSYAEEFKIAFDAWCSENRDVVKFVCKKGDFKGEADVRVQLFDAFESYDMLNEFFCKHNKKLMEDKATYFEGYDFEAWDDYVIIENGEIISRAGIWKMNDTEWEVAGVSTLPEYRKQGYGEAVVKSCIAKIIEAGRVATCTTKTTNIAMINTALKAGFNIVE